ncbi:nucleotidyl transferase AbiEii/AbiGii toxin family protein [Kitasatospora viridis]|uniref:Nucleotidyltransferase AbiEii toxin of type IV toxin-antitoxin system n=1 Tax=Kitasatospora viridis TaxID=281105 RepID=A0A561T775_9ACTN|nr:nucleotidyl transferase AbiEii/AbiGii toxin family protein [Kitasatospora viridis]TWF82959.1 nucleotidyltransferase AbiEii toxin of type IV toxin-antitoxin system [Kitasatospora viridis]
MNPDWHSFGWTRGSVPRQPLSDTERADLGVPLTLRPVTDERAQQAPVFDPALQHLRYGYRAADPRFEEPELAAAWPSARRRALDLVLAAVADSRWVDHLVLRGSVLLRAWYGEAAREPGDLDFVVVPRDWMFDDLRSTEMLDGIAAAVERTAAEAGGPVRFEAAAAAVDDIWTYDRVPGVRMVLPWTAGELPGGTVQIDFVFTEPLPLPPEPIAIPSATGDRAAVLHAATPELSLAWKLMWLLTDDYPQGKDLYDAVLLAEHGPLRYRVLRDAFAAGGPEQALRPVLDDAVPGIGREVEWEDFQQEYPVITAGADEYVARLGAALAPTFAQEPAGLTEPGLRNWWLAGWLERYRAGFDAAGLAATLETMAQDRLELAAAVLIVRELLGRDRTSMEQARESVLADPAWLGWTGPKHRDPNAHHNKVLRGWEY